MKKLPGRNAYGIRHCSSHKPTELHLFRGAWQVRHVMNVKKAARLALLSTQSHIPHAKHPENTYAQIGVVIAEL